MATVPSFPSPPRLRHPRSDLEELMEVAGEIFSGATEQTTMNASTIAAAAPSIPPSTPPHSTGFGGSGSGLRTVGFSAATALEIDDSDDDDDDVVEILEVGASI